MQQSLPRSIWPSSGTPHGEAVALGWTEVDFDDGSIYILDNLPGSGSSPTDDLDPDLDDYDDPKSEAGHRTVSLDPATEQVLTTWQGRQNEERTAHRTAWIDSGRVFTHPDGSRLTPNGVSQRFERLVTRFATIRREHTEHDWTIDQLTARHFMPAEVIDTAITFGPLPPIRLHDLRHTAASLTYRATKDLKVVSELLGHASVHFTGDIYTSIFADADRAAAKAAADIVPRRHPPGQTQPQPDHPALPQADSTGADGPGFEL